MILYSLYWLGDFNANIHFIFKLCDTLIVVVSQITSFWLFVRTQGFEAVIYLVIVLYYPGQAAACSLCHILETTDCSSCWSSGHRAGTQRAVGPVHTVANFDWLPIIVINSFLDEILWSVSWNENIFMLFFLSNSVWLIMCCHLSWANRISKHEVENVW